MADNSKGLDIRVTITADTASGSRQAAGDLNRLTDATNDATPATDKLSDAEKEAGEHAERAHVSHRAMRMTMMELGRNTVPELGQALYGLSLGPIGVLIAIGALAQELKKDFDGLTETAKKNAEAFDGYDEAAAKIREMAKAAGEYETHAANIADSEERIATALKDQATYRQAIRDAQAKVDKAADTATVSGIDAALAAGRMTAAQADANKAALQTGSAARENTASKNAADTEIPLLNEQLVNAQRRQKEVERQLAEARHASDASELAKTHAPSTIKELQERQTTLNTSIEAMTQQLRELKQQRILGPGEPVLIDQQIAGVEDLLRQATAQLAANFTSIANQNKALNDTGGDANKLKTLSDQNDKLLKQIADLQAQIPQAQKLAGLDQGTNATLALLDAVKILNELLSKDRTAEVAPGISEGFLQDVNTAENAKANGQKLTDAQKATLKQFALITQQQLDHHTELGNFLMQWARDYKDAKALINDLKNQLNFRPLRAPDQGGH